MVIYLAGNSACHTAGIQYFVDWIKEMIELKSYLVWVPDSRKAVIATFLLLAKIPQLENNLFALRAITLRKNLAFAEGYLLACEGIKTYFQTHVII